MKAKRRSISAKKAVPAKGAGINAFFAFPSKPDDKLKIIEESIEEINKTKKINITSWRKIDKGSSRIIANILDSINNKEVFYADISGLNPNVLFEAGYAFGKNKKIRLFTQGMSSEERDSDIRDSGVLSGIDINKFSNKKELVDNILSDINCIKKVSAEFEKYIMEPEPTKGNSGFFLRGYCGHQIAIDSLIEFQNIFTDHVIDDWSENSAQALGWYVKNVFRSSGVVGIFVPSKWDDSRRMNARFSFVCGMAVALEKKVCMIGMPGYKPALDYSDIFKQPKDSDYAAKEIRQYFEILQTATLRELVGASKSLSIATRRKLDSKTKEFVLLNISLGDTIAENEEMQLQEYFIETGQFYKALKLNQAVIVGSKGTGKTATFYQLRDRFAENKKNLVCQIKPSDYKMARFLGAVKKLVEKDGFIEHVLENVWKYIIYCEIVNTLNARFEERLSAVGFSQEEKVLIDFLKSKENVINVGFERKLEIATQWLEECAYEVDNFSKKIHDYFITEAHAKLLPVLKEYNGIIVLLDNLDKSWKTKEDLEIQGHLILALLGIYRRINHDFCKDLEARVYVFLRRNIFEYILSLPLVREPDKLIAEHVMLVWNDKEMLLRVLKERFDKAIKKCSNSTDSEWIDLVPTVIEGKNVEEWIYENIFPRPRDLIHLVQKAIEFAINRGHSEIEEKDFIDAQNDYAHFALEQIKAEYKTEEPWIESITSSFYGKAQEWPYSYLYNHIKKIESSWDPKRVIACLVEIGFIGIKNKQEVEYVSTIEKSRVMVGKVAGNPQDQPLSLVIHPIFCKSLSIMEGSKQCEIDLENYPNVGWIGEYFKRIIKGE